MSYIRWRDTNGLHSSYAPYTLIENIYQMILNDTSMILIELRHV